MEKHKKGQNKRRDKQRLVWRTTVRSTTSALYEIRKDTMGIKMTFVATLQIRVVQCVFKLKSHNNFCFTLFIKKIEAAAICFVCQFVLVCFCDLGRRQNAKITLWLM